MDQIKKWGEGTKHLTPAHHAFQVGKVQIYFGKLKNFGLSFFNNHSKVSKVCVPFIKISGEGTDIACANPSGLCLALSCMLLPHQLSVWALPRAFYISHIHSHS